MRNKKINIGLIWADPYKENLGVSALAYSTLFLFEIISKQKNLNFNYTIIGGNGPKTDQIKIGDCNIQINNIPWNFNGSFKSFIKLLFVRWYQIINLFKIDIVFDIGAGDSFSDIYGIERFRKINGSKKIISFLGKRVVLLPQTLGPFNTKEAKKKATISINKAHLVLTRDKQSYTYIKSLLPAKKVIELIDIAFFMPFTKKIINGNKVKIGINVSGLLWNGGYTKNNQFQLKTSYKTLMDKIILYFLNIPETEIYLISHVLMKEYNDVENDVKVCTELNQLYPKTIIAPFFTNPIEAKSFISGLDFFTGARMHACIAAFSTGIPVFPLAYSRKFNGLFGETLGYKYYGDLVNSNINDLLRDLETAYCKKTELKEIISTTLNSLISQKESELINLISDAITVKKYV